MKLAVLIDKLEIIGKELKKINDREDEIWELDPTNPANIK